MMVNGINKLWRVAEGFCASLRVADIVDGACLSVALCNACAHSHDGDFVTLFALNGAGKSPALLTTMPDLLPVFLQ